MADIEKVIKGLECCIKQGEQGILDCDYDCPYGEHGNRLDCWIKMNRDALAMLKEQDAKKQISDDIHETAKQFRQTIVRCKDCRHYENCEVNDLLLNHENGYCSDGERKE